MNKAVRKWLLKAAREEPNPFMAAELLYQALGNGKPYPWKPIREHFNVFREA